MLPAADWPTSIAAAKALQHKLRRRVVTVGEALQPRIVAGVDVHMAERTGLSWAALALLDAQTLELQESVLASLPTSFPYVPGYLSFREIPVILSALAMLRRPPDLLMVDGHGIAHPRRLGIAAHLGVITDLPAIGVAKSRLFGRHEEPAMTRGSCTPLTSAGETIGMVVRTRDKVRPVFVSVGHKIGLAQAVELALGMTTRYRLPEPTRQADKVSRMHPL